MGRRGSVNMQQQQQATKSMSTPSKKKQKIKEEKSSPSKSTTEVANKKDVDILPWNVLLRITIRMTAHVVNQLNGCNTSAAAGKKQEDDEHEQDKRGEANVHPLLQVLDIVSGSLHLLTRIQKQHLQQQSQESDQNEIEAKIATPTKKKRSTQPPSQSTAKAQLPKDRMLYDWKSNNSKLKTCPSRLSPTSREIWGPSRYTFLKDIDSITQLLKVDKDASNIMGINHDEWYERINSIVQSLDECVSVERQLQFGNDVSPIRHHESGTGGQLHQSAALGISPSLLRYGNKSPLKSGTPKSPSLASITKAHVERMSAQKKADRESCKKKLAFASSLKLADEQVSGGVSVNLQAMMNKESHYPVKMEEGVDKEDEKDSELVDAYRMAIIFGSSNSGGEQDMARETIERRLTILVHKVNETEDKQLDTKESASLNVDGALSYLETFLRTLIKPRDSNVWFKLLSKSDGIETPIMLRRGRSSLISFLIGIKSPGWQEADNQLISSPVPSYLGYLSCSENAVQPSNKAKGQQAMHHRSSYFLPAVEMGETTLPPSPVVTEVGLSLCIKNFLHKDTPTGCSISQQPSSKTSQGVCIFKNYEPIQTSSSTNVSDDILNSIETTPLSDVNELIRDLFDLILRLATDDDVDHENKPFSLRLTTSSPSESLNIVLNVVSEHLDWLSPHSITSRYRFVLQHIIQSLSGDSVSSDLVDDDEDDEELESWSKRASYVIDATKTSNRGQMALYMTQFMMLLCSRGKGNTHKSSFPGSTKQHFYTCLQLRQSSQFWNQIDKSVDDYSSNIMTRVLDNEFALQYLLPLSHRCALLLASSNPSLSRNNTSNASHEQDIQSIQTLITILTSVLDVVADNGYLKDCNIGWALQMLALTVNHFGGEGECSTDSNSIWEDISRQLNRLYFSVWGQDWKSIQSRTNNLNQDYIVYEAIDHDHSGTRMVVLMPCFDMFAVSLIKFVCNLKVESNEDTRRFCAFIARVTFDRYDHALQSSSNSSKDAPPQVEHKWIALLASTLQDMMYSQKSSNESIGRKRDDKADDDDKTTDRALADLITPALKCLHMLIMKRVLKTSSSRQETTSRLPEPVASVFVALHQQESEKFIKKPSSAKTRRWGVYRKCLEQIFTLIPTSVLFAYHGNSALTEHSADVLETIWNQYGQCELSHSISIMVAAALHVNASAVCLRSDSLSSMGHKDDSSQHLKQLYSTFSSRARDCIINTFQCFKAEQKTKHSLDDSQTDINGLIRFVRIELSHQSEAEVGLSWWNEVSSDLLSLLAKSEQQTNEVDDKKKNAAATKNIKLSAISSG